MLGLTCFSHPPNPFPIRSAPLVSPNNNLSYPSLLPKSQPQIPRKPTRFLVVLAENNNNNNNNNNGLSKDPKESNEEEEKEGIGSKSNGDDDDLGKNGRPIFNIRWGDLLDPDPDNILALALTGLLTWASVQVLWQLFFISVAILLAALKYSFVAALLLFILITLL
uniref:Transmembrane protein n=1 Tax=Quercus lobata TaxID=97700 RepID=A0A7N2LES3_QUELO